MKKDIAFIAVGQAGGNIGSLFEAMKFKVLYINTSMEEDKYGRFRKNYRQAVGSFSGL